jgi:minor extracellular serine protease Vpr
MKRLWLLFACVPLFAAGTVPGRYIVELSTESVVAHMVRVSPRAAGRVAVHSTEAELHRSRILAEQTAATSAIQSAGGEVAGAVENVDNALLVRIPDARAARLAAIPGVLAVYPERTFHLLLDHALPLHHVPAAWTQVGAGNAGAGIKIAIIDTGVDIGHPGFQDATFQAPSGFPRADTQADLAYANNKVIVARSYAKLFATTDPDPSAADHVGHGTATAMAAAGVQNTGPLATISGVAPRAYIGSYKVFGTPGVNDNATESAILQAINDAVSDAMDVISLSLGSDVAPLPSNDPEVTSLQSAASAGIVVVAAAGNNGPDPATVGSPASGASVIAVGASANDRLFASSVLVPGSSSLEAAPGSASMSASPVTAAVVDVAKLDGSGLACAALPANSLSGSIALIFRGTCTFESKLNNAQAAGAVGGLVYDNVAQEAPLTMAMGTASLPSEMISNQDGLALKQRTGRSVAVTRHPLIEQSHLHVPFRPPVQTLSVTLQFNLEPAYTNPSELASFSAEGPNVDLTIKPDMVAVGVNMYTAAEKLDPNGGVYSPTGYAVEQGTSFSTPLVAGAAALLKAARPGLTSAQYRSLLVNSADPAFLVPGTPATVQQAGAGILDVLSAINATAAAAPVSLSFGAGSGTINSTETLNISNVSTAPDTFRVLVVPSNGAAAPTVSSATFDLAAGGTTGIPVQFSAAGLAPGQYEGYITIQGTHSGIPTRVPYWYGVQSTTPGHITVLDSTSSAPAGSVVTQAILFRITDPSGIPMNASATVVPVSGGGTVTTRVQSVNSQSPYSYVVSVKLGPTPGDNVFRIQVGSLTKDVTITGQ